MRRNAFKIETVHADRVLEAMGRLDEQGYDIINILGPVNNSKYTIVCRQPVQNLELSEQ